MASEFLFNILKIEGGEWSEDLFKFIKYTSYKEEYVVKKLRHCLFSLNKAMVIY